MSGMQDHVVVEYWEKITTDRLREWRKAGVKYIVAASRGTDHIPVQEAKEMGMELHSLTDYSTNAVAEFIFRQILLFYRPSQFSRFGRELKGKTIGVIGRGRIGTAVAKIAEGFGMAILSYDKYKNDTKKARDALLKGSDIIVLCVPLSEETRHMIAKKEFEKMQQCPLLVNCSRKDLVDNSALKDALNGEKIAGYIIDDTVKEGCQRILQSPHIAWKTRESQQRKEQEIRQIMGRIKREK